MIGQNSRYNYSAIMRVLNAAGSMAEREHLDIRQTLVNIVHLDNREYTPTETDTWSRIAWRTLGDGRFWWIIADFSQVIDPFSEIKPKETTKYVTQLTVNVGGSATISQITVAHPKKVRRGDVLRVEDLNQANLGSMDCPVLAVNETTGVVTISPTLSPTGGVPFALSRISRVYKEQLRLVVPSVNRAFFESLNFGNPMNVLIE